MLALQTSSNFKDTVFRYIDKMNVAQFNKKKQPSMRWLLLNEMKYGF